MAERMDFWRGFSGGFLAGVAIGALIYFSPSSREGGENTARENFNSDVTDELFLNRDAAESAGDPSSLVPNTAGAARIDFERTSRRLA